MNELDYVLEHIDEEINVVRDAVTNGSVKDYAEYQHLCGKIRGLLEARSIIIALIERMEQNDE